MLLKAYRREHVKKMLDDDQFSIERLAVACFPFRSPVVTLWRLSWLNLTA